MTLRWRVLGPVRITANGVELTLDAPLLRGFVAVLALNANQYVSASRLAHNLWADPPNSAEDEVRAQAAALGETLGRAGHCARLSNRSGLGGYRLAIESDELDVQVFNELADRGRGHLRSGRFALAESSLQRALWLYGDPVGRDVPHTPALVGWYRDLDRRRRAAEEDLDEARLGVRQPGLVLARRARSKVAAA